MRYAPTETARAWLPQAAIVALEIDAALADLARAWSTKWFARSIVRPLKTLSESLSVAEATETLTLDRDLAIVLSPSARSTLLGSMLGTVVTTETPTASDERLRREITQACLDDLCRRLTEIFKLDTAARWDRSQGDVQAPIDTPLTCTFGAESQATLLTIVVARDVLIGVAKAGLPPPEQPPLPGKIAEGLALQQISIATRIGRCALTIAEAADLAVGDVLVFDRPTNAPLELLVNGMPVSRCSVVQAETGLDLLLLDSIGG